MSEKVYMDEKILDMMKEMEERKKKNSAAVLRDQSKQQSIQKMFVNIGDKTISFEEKSLLEDKIKIRLPKFNLMSPETAALKYPSERRPGLIFTNESASVNIAFNHTKSTVNETQMEEFKNYLVQVLKKTQPSARWFEDGVKEINGKKVGFCDFLAPALDSNIYNLMFFTELEGRALLCTFNCTEEEMEDWKPIARGMMDSLILCKEEWPEKKPE